MDTSSEREAKTGKNLSRFQTKVDTCGRANTIRVDGEILETGFFLFCVQFQMKIEDSVDGA